jgi:glutathione S-transferase
MVPPHLSGVWSLAMTITLYDIHLSPHARKVRLLAAELNIPLNKITRDPRTGETRTPEYLAKNPNGRVPTLEEDGFVLWESPAILKYLAAKHPERALCGGDAKTQALVDQWMCWWIGGPEAAIDTLAWEVLIKPKVFNQPGNDPGIIADAHRRIERYLPVLDKQLEGRDYVVGPLTIVDFLIGPRLDTAPAILRFDTSGYANIAAWQERLKAKSYWSAV